MLNRPPSPNVHRNQTVRSLRALLVLSVACALFVAVALGVVAAPNEPPTAPPLPGPAQHGMADTSGV